MRRQGLTSATEVDREACELLRRACATALGRMPTSEGADREAMDGPPPAGVAADRHRSAIAFRIGQKAALQRVLHELDLLGAAPGGAPANRLELLSALRRARV